MHQEIPASGTFGRRARLMGAGAGFVAGAAWLLSRWSEPQFQVWPAKKTGAKNVSDQLPNYLKVPIPDEDSGVFSVFFLFALPLEDPRSLESIRASFYRAGYRGIEQIEKDLAVGRIPESLVPTSLVIKAKLCLYEGEFGAAAAALQQARSLLEKAAARRPKELEWVIKMQGIAALRRGETENCVECGCDAACVFPIQPKAVHTKKAGSSDAIKYFSEYLERHPDSIEERWPLNLAHMTLGQYPDKVPSRYLIPVKPFESELDIGRFTDVAAELGVNRLSMAGGAIMEDFDNDGLLDIVLSAQDVAGSMALYRNRGDGRFEDCTKGSGLDQQLGGLYCVQTDYDNNGLADIFLCRGAWTQVAQRLRAMQRAHEVLNYVGLARPTHVFPGQNIAGSRRLVRQPTNFPHRAWHLFGPKASLSTHSQVPELTTRGNGDPERRARRGTPKLVSSVTTALAGHKTRICTAVNSCWYWLVSTARAGR